MKKYLFSHGAALAAISAGTLAVLNPAPAAATTSAAACPATPAVEQFLSWGDSNLYTPAPGVSSDNFAGTGWVLAGGAKLVRTVLADGTTGLVLDLPPGATATSPVMCVQSGEPIARQITRMVGTNAPSNATTFYVSAAGSTQLGSGMPVLGTTVWALSPPDNVFPGSGTADVYFTYKSAAKVGDLQVYDLYIDPKFAR